MLVLKRVEKETWLQAAQRLAAEHGLVEEVTRKYYDFRRSGKDEEDAAWEACYQWDVLKYEPGIDKANG